MKARRYYPSQKKLLITFIGTLAIWSLILATPTPLDARRTIASAVEGTMAFVALMVVVHVLVACSCIEIDSESITYVQFDFDWKRRAPINNIIGIGFPTRNWFVPVMYIWYDDPTHPGVDKYIKIKQAVFDDETLVKIALDLKAANPRIKIDDKLTKLIQDPRMNERKAEDSNSELVRAIVKVGAPVLVVGLITIALVAWFLRGGA